ncbi:MAG: 3-isopropylmalate dehydratase small subunit [Parvibaculaceae bacterium]|nr:3-isopropylmalate dehydratase small subunit [Parvibaculaceae bacterium]
MQAFTSVSGAAAPLMLSNVDTDVIIRIERLTSGADLGHFAFEALRYLPDGTPDPECVLNEPRFSGAPILLAGRNFGCGSSREGAVTALMGMGVRCVIAPGFGDIFFANSFRNGLLPVVLAEEIVERLAAQSRDGNFTVDLQSQTVEAPSGEQVAFSVDKLQRDGLLEGLDDIGLTLKSSADIHAWQMADRVHRPWVWQTER